MAFTGSLTKITLSSKGNITKGADADTQVVLPHSLGVIPDQVSVHAISGTEAGWLIGAVDATNVTLDCSTTGGTAASVCQVVALVHHSIIK